MLKPAADKIAKHLRKLCSREDSFLRNLNGVIHVGANTGQEREVYSRFGLRVIWIEPVQTVYDQLRHNLLAFPKQNAYNYLITDRDGAEYEFYIASNNGASSSVFQFAKHSEMYPEISMCEMALLRSITLSSLVREQRIDLEAFQGLVLDTQGSELLVLRGATDILPNFRFVKVEASNFEAYEKGCQDNDLAEYMRQHGFREARREVMKALPGVGTYYDILYERN